MYLEINQDNSVYVALGPLKALFQITSDHSTLLKVKHPLGQIVLLQQAEYEGNLQRGVAVYGLGGRYYVTS